MKWKTLRSVNMTRKNRKETNKIQKKRNSEKTIPVQRKNTVKIQRFLVTKMMRLTWNSDRQQIRMVL